MKLYYSAGACSLAPHIVLQELGIAHQLVEVKFDSPPAELLKLNPMGAVPILVLDNGEPLTEGSAILQYLADQKPEAGLAPKVGTLERTRLQETLNFISTEVHKGFGILFAMPSISQNPGVQEEVRVYGIKELQRRFEILNERLGKNEYLMGADFSVADAYLFTVMNWAAYLKVEISKYSALTAFMARVAARPAVKRTMEIEDLL